MDPQAVWEVVSSPKTYPQERAQAGVDLLVWIAKGGYGPDAGWELSNPEWIATVCEAAVLQGIESEQWPTPPSPGY